MPFHATAQGSWPAGIAVNTLFDDPSITVRFRLKGEPKTSFLAWTTTPWTLPSNTALAVHPDVEYAQIEVQGEQFILAKQLIPAVFKGLPVNLEKDVRTVRTVKGKDLVGTKYEPIFKYKQPEGGKAWEDYRAKVFARILQEQNPDGSWVQGYIGPVYTTAINLTILQLENAALPIYQR